jgi:uncharacterized caspase-like protein
MKGASQAIRRPAELILQSFGPFKSLTCFMRCVTKVTRGQPIGLSPPVAVINGIIAICRYFMRTVWAIASAVFLLVFLSQPASAEKRVALVIGNSAYQNVGRLTNPANDAAAITTTLKNARFDVVESRRDLSTVEMRRTLRDFANKTRDADVAVVYYAGHGIEVDGTNYLIPVDAQLEQDTDVYDEAFALDRILVAVEPAKQLRLVILDACRDNPFAKTMKRTLGSRAVGRGLAKVEPSSPNTMIAFAAKAGSTASDGDTANSPFATALVEHLMKPGLDLRKAFGFVRDDVLKATGNKQEPFVYGSLGGNDVSLVPAAAPVAAAPPPATTPSPPVSAGAERAYEFALAVGTKAVWEAFIANYPAGFYTELAKAQRNKVAAEEARVAATERAKAAEEDKTRLQVEGARAAEQAKANAQAKAAEEARLAAEKKKAAEDTKVAEAERAKAAAMAKAEETARLAAEKKKAAEDAKVAEAERNKAAAAAKAEAAAKPAADAATGADKPVGLIVALAPAERAVDADANAGPPAAIEIPRLLQSELRRVGCNSGSVDGNWNAAAQKSLGLFNKYAGMKLDVKVASLDALDAIKSKPSRICPPICEHGFKTDGERCMKITCRAGYEVGDDNECEKIETRKPAAKREQAAKPQRTASEPAAVAKPAASSGQILCNNQGCRPVTKGCRLRNGTAMYGTQSEICD